jgi:hypothetical protein
MFSIFLDHHSQKLARRALLTAAFLTILVPALNIQGALDFFGLSISISKNNVLTVGRIVTAYFLWVFGWFVVYRYYGAIEKFILVVFSSRTSKYRDIANLEDAEFNGVVLRDPSDVASSWWATAKRVEMQEYKAKELLKGASFALRSIMELSIEFMPPIAIGIAAVFSPELVSSYFLTKI